MACKSTRHDSENAHSGLLRCAISSLTALQHLSLAGSMLANERAQLSLVYALPQCPALRSLKFSGSNQEDHGAVVCIDVLQPALQRMPSLVALRFTRCEMSAYSDVGALAPALQALSIVHCRRRTGQAGARAMAAVARGLAAQTGLH